jgi:hypothetical protein
MFADIFNYVLCMAYQNQYMIQSITGDQSMVIARTQSNGAVSLNSFGAATWRDFPFQLTAPEMLIRRKPPCATLLAVNERHSCLSIRPQGFVRAQERDQTSPHHPLQLERVSSVSMHEVVQVSLPCRLRFAWTRQACEWDERSPLFNWTPMLEGAPIISTASVWLGLSLQATRSLQPKFTGSILSAPYPVRARLNDGDCSSRRE